MSAAHNRINSLLLLWQEQQEQGRERSAAELCRDCPELEPELREQIRILCHMNGLLGPPGDAVTVTGELSRGPGVPPSRPELDAGRAEDSSNPLILKELRKDSGGTSSNQDPKTPREGLPALQVPGYELLQELGQGGMGVVYLARQTRLNRLVALKMVRAGRLARTDELKRFQTEAEAVARLQHPNIVQVFEVGEHEGQPFFSLEFCPGGSLDKKLAGSPLPPKEAARLAETLARAVQALHQANVIHRDLKPANVLLAADGAAKITDFGLAKKLDEASQTQTGSVVGTPSYMAPEQAEGKKAVGPAVDVYALGAILYECLTGRPPFKAATVMDTVLQVIHTEPVAPRQLQPQLPRDLETLCLKCLQKEPRKRYFSAAELAEDLRRWRSGEAVKARPVGVVERGLKWVRRRPAAAVAYGLVMLVVVLGGLGGGAAWLWQNSEHARGQLAEEKRQSEEARQQADQARAKLAEVSYLHRIGLAYREWDDAEVGRADQLLQSCPPEQRGWEWHYVHRLCHAELRTFPADTSAYLPAAFSTDARRFATASTDHSIKIWDLATGQIIVTCRGHSKTVLALAFNSDGLRLVSTSRDQTVRLWDTQTGREVLALRQNSDVTGAAVSPDGQYIAAGCGKEIKLWDARNGNEVQTFTGLAGIVQGVAFSPNGQWLAGCSAVAGKASVKVWETQTGKVVLSIGHNDLITRVAFSRDGKHLAGFAGFAKAVRVWDVQTGQIVFSLIGHTDIVSCVAYSRDGTHLATASADYTARIWDAGTGQELAGFRGHKRSVSAVAFSADGQRLATASTDGTVKVWDATADPRAGVLRGHTRFVTTVRFSPDGKTIVSSGCDGIRFWDVPSRRHERLVQAHARCTESMALSQDGRFLVSGGTDGSIKLWDAKTCKKIWTIAGHTIPVQTVAISPNGALIASASGIYNNSNLSPGEVKLWNVQDGSEIRTLQGNTKGFNCVAFSPDSQSLVCGGKGNLAVWQVATGQQLFSLAAHEDSVVDVAFSPDGRRIASASYDKTVKLWDASDGKAIYTFGGHTARVTCVAFSPDGQRIASGGDDHYIRIIVAHNGEETLSIKGTLGPVHTLAFSPDGHLLVSGGWDNLLRVWDARPLDRSQSRLPLPQEMEASR